MTTLATPITFEEDDFFFIGDESSVQAGKRAEKESLSKLNPETTTKIIELATALLAVLKEITDVKGLMKKINSNVDFNKFGLAEYTSFFWNYISWTGLAKLAVFVPLAIETQGILQRLDINLAMDDLERSKKIIEFLSANRDVIFEVIAKFIGEMPENPHINRFIEFIASV